MPISLVEISFFAPFTMGISALVASSITNAMTTYSEHVETLQIEARDAKEDVKKSSCNMGDLLKQINLQKNPEEKVPATIVDDLRTIDTNHDLFVKMIAPRNWAWKLFGSHTLNEHRSKNVNRSVYAALVVVILVIMELVGFSATSIPYGNTDASMEVNFNVVGLLILTYILLKNLASLKASSMYISALSQDLSISRSSIRLLLQQLDYSNEVSKALEDALK